MSALPLHRSPAPAPARAPRPKAKPDLRVVEAEETEVRESIIGRVGITLLVLLFVAVFGLVVFQAVLAQSQRRLDDVRRDLSAQELDAKALRLQLATAESPDRIAAAARTRLRMIPPGEVVFLEPSPEDDAKARFDPAKEPTTTATTPAAVPPTTAWRAPATTVAPGRGAATTVKPRTTPTTTRTTPTTKAPPTTRATPTTVARTR